MATLFRLPKPVVVDSGGTPYAGAKATFYTTGTTTKTDVYTDAALSVAHSNPVVANAAGVFAPIWLDPEVTYKLTLTDANDVLIYTVDPVSDSLTADNIGAILYAKTPAETTAGVTPVNLRYPELDVRRYGTNTTPGTTDLKTAIQNAIDVCSERGGGFVDLPPETCGVSGYLELPSKVILRGHGTDVTRIKLLSGSDTDIIRSKDFSTYTGNNHTQPSVDGIPYQFGLRDLTIDGNASGQTSTDSYGVRFYGVGWIVDNVVISETKGVGFYTEAGAEVAAQPEDFDMLEARIGVLKIYHPGTDGFIMRGPHDSRFDEIIIAEAGTGGSGVGFKTQFATSTYSGTCDINFMHVYACSGDGVLLNEAIRIQHLMSESNTGRGLGIIKVAGVSDPVGTRIGYCYLFKNNSGGTAGDNVACEITTSECQIDTLRIKDENDGGGLFINGGFYNQIGNLSVVGTSGTQVGVDIDGNDNQIGNLRIKGYSGTGGIGLRTGNSGALTGTEISAGWIEDCDTLWDNEAAGLREIINLRGAFTATTQTGFSGVQPSNTWSSTWNVIFRDSGGTYYKSKNKILVSSAVALDSTTLQTFTVDHEMLATPRPEDVRVTFNQANNSPSEVIAIDQLSVYTISATQVSVLFKLGTAGSAGKTGRIYAEINLT